MKEELIRKECCQQHEKLPENIDCFIPGICSELKDLIDIHQKAFIKNKRILELAKPRHVKQRYVKKCPCLFKKPIEIINLEQFERTRTNQLAYPMVWKLLLFKQRVSKLFKPDRMQGINRLIRYSLLSVYGRLSGAVPPKPRVPIPQWDKKEWKKHTRYLKKLAKPKKILPQPKLPRTAMEYKKMKRYKTLAIPKHFVIEEKEPWKLTPEARFYSPTDRINILAVPKESKLGNPPLEVPVPISESAKTYKASKRIKELAVPNDKRTEESDIKENPFAIAPNALKAKASARIEELAEPKEYENVHIRENPFAISPAALKAKASPRTIELAKPKGS